MHASSRFDLCPIVRWVSIFAKDNRRKVAGRLIPRRDRLTAILRTFHNSRSLLLIFTALLFETSAIANTKLAGRAPGNPHRNTIAIGGSHSCQVRPDGTVQCWGGNGGGQLGDGTLTDRPLPVFVSGLTDAVSVVGGINFSCALRAGGTVQCWGSNGNGQLGNNSTTDSKLPVNVSNLSNVTMISTYGDASHVCALQATGAVVCWGSNLHGDLGDNTITDRHIPVQVSGLSDAVAVSVNGLQSCAARANGTVRCWGNNLHGQLGDNTTTDRHIPVQVVGINNAIAVAVGDSHACALLADGTVHCWGDNSSGELGNGFTTEQHAPVQVVGLTNVVELGAGSFFTCALRADGTLQCWGSNKIFGVITGTLGVGNTLSGSTVPVPLGLVDVTSLGVGQFHSCAGKSDGSVFCWGLNNHGQIGDGSLTNRFTPALTAVIGGTISAIAVTASSLHSCAIRSNGNSACWGANTIGQLGDGTSGNIRTSPVVVNGLASPAAISAGDQHTCGVRAPGNLMCWGSDVTGQLGDNSLLSETSPVFVSGIANARAVVGGGNHSCALLGDGTVQCWGSNSSGQLGNGDATLSTRKLPVSVLSISNVLALAAGTLHTCALIADGTVRCWGENGSGQLGDGTNGDHSTPVQVSGITNAIAIAAGNAHTCVVLSDGTARCWGAGAGGQLGNGAANSPIPLQVLGLTNAVTIVGGDLHSCALRSDGTVRCWGKNSSGQLGTGDTSDQPTPVPVANLTNVLAIAAGIHGIHTCSLRVNGAPQCWGANNAGQIGDGGTTTSNRPSATQVPSFTFNVDPDVVVSANGRIAHVTALANCPADAHAHIRIELTQGNVSGVGQTIGECTGGLNRYPVVVPAFGRDGFLTGPGQADADAVVKERQQILEVEEWSREVTVSVDPHHAANP